MTLSLCLLPAGAQAPSGFVHFGSSQLKSYEKKLAPRVNPQKFANEQLFKYGNHFFLMTYREGSGEAEVHEKQDDIFIVESGVATLVVGGKVVGGRSTALGEIRGPSIEGGQKQKLAPGDIVNIPVGLPHQVLLDAGKTFTYLIVKVDEK